MAKYNPYMWGTVQPLAEAFGGGVGRGMSQEQEFRRLIENQMRAFESLRPMRQAQRGEDVQEQEEQEARRVGRKYGPTARESYRTGTYPGDVAQGIASEEASLPAILRMRRAETMGGLDVQEETFPRREKMAGREATAKQNIEEGLLQGALGMEERRAKAGARTQMDIGETLQPRQLALEDLATTHRSIRARGAEKKIVGEFVKVFSPRLIPFLDPGGKAGLTAEDLANVPLKQWDDLIRMHTAGASLEERDQYHKELNRISEKHRDDIFTMRQSLAESTAKRAEAAARSAESSAGRRDIQNLGDLLKMQGINTGGRGSGGGGVTEAPPVSEGKLREETYKDLQRQIASLKGTSRPENVVVPPALLDQAMEQARGKQAYKVTGQQKTEPTFGSRLPLIGGLFNQTQPTGEWDYQVQGEETKGGRQRESTRPGAGPGIGPELRKGIEQKTQELINRVTPKSKKKKEE